MQNGENYIICGLNKRKQIDEKSSLMFRTGTQGFIKVLCFFLKINEIIQSIFRTKRLHKHERQQRNKSLSSKARF